VNVVGGGSKKAAFAIRCFASSSFLLFFSLLFFVIE